jgi:hypothetical protein
MKKQLNAKLIAYGAISEMETQIAYTVRAAGMDRDPMVADVMIEVQSILTRWLTHQTESRK